MIAIYSLRKVDEEGKIIIKNKKLISKKFSSKKNCEKARYACYLHGQTC